MKKSIVRACAISASAAVALALALPAAASASVDTPELITPTAGTTQLNLIGFNDFHGRILDAERFAATVLQAQQGFGEDNSLVLSNGDAVSASVFESAIQKDAPTIDALNALGVDSFTVGNHEFDHGYDDAIGRIQNATNGPDLAANVTDSTGAHPFDEYAIFDVNGTTVAVIGAVTQETPALSSPDSVAGLTFGDPVEAVNRVAAQLTDGDASNGEADVLIASYHEGGPQSDVPLDENEKSAVFAHIVNDTDASVAAIYTAHTHQTYAYDAPIPGQSGTRPVVQAGSYAGYIGQVVLTLDADKKVTASSSSVVPTLAADAIPDDLKSDPRVQQVAQIVADAVAKADVLGNEVVGTQTGDITRAKQYEPGSITVDPATGVTSGTVSVPDDRANASNLSDLVAQSMVEVINARGNVRADIALMNPGGVRADLINDDGKITYKEAATVVPFANDLNVVTITTETLKATLEQQWQRNVDGSIPSRPYLQLGLSDNLTYTYDSSRPEGDRITGISLYGVPLPPGDKLNVAMSSFLAAGGDNFRALLDNEGNQSVGIIDTDAFPAWFRMVSGDTGAPIVPDNRRNGIEVQGLVSNQLLPCTGQSITVSGFDLASLGYVQNQSVTATLRYGVGFPELGTAVVDPATPNTAVLSLTAPAGAVGDAQVEISVEPSGSHVTIPVTVDCAVAPTPVPTAVPSNPAPKPTLAATGSDGSQALTIGIIAVVVIVAGGAALIIARLRRARREADGASVDSSGSSTDI
ncbi:bifunctional metallophosphatase/5'-nucleotidase [Microbacterium gorillae]|uniref:bifunctional metallophosphatase/5'-nucleotidase n=1 Tax=Microbacterium gorillae TaxID=1231063 RepID=UPI003D97C033